MSVDFVMCARNVKDRRRRFGDEPGETKFLFVPEDAQPVPSQAKSKTEWAKAVIAEATVSRTPERIPIGDILVFIHGFNNSQSTVMERHRKLKSSLREIGYQGTVVSFDWPSGDSGVAYLEDRHDAKKTAMQLVTDGIFLLADLQQPDCRINIHLLAHSMGALVVREAFEDADDSHASATNWIVSQILFIGGDVSSGSLSADDSDSESLYRHGVRLTNYSNRHDGALALSNVKRVGIAPRVGRHGLPDDAPFKAINVDCSDYWETIPSTQPVIGSREHSWHIGDPVFTRDMLYTIEGLERNVIPTRRLLPNGKLVLVHP
jgi:esterase/lipase superfamily enzyme